MVAEQMTQFERTGLWDAASEIIVGINGGSQSADYARLIIPPKAKFLLHGYASRSECLTIAALEKHVKNINREAYIFYAHSKGGSHSVDSPYGNNVSGPWRRGMMCDLVDNWHQCVHDLDAGADIVCSHWMWNMADGTQHIPAGNFLWVKATFLSSLPSIYLRERIKTSGISALESRFEAEVYWGNGRRPIVKERRPGGGGGVP